MERLGVNPTLYATSVIFLVLFAGFILISTIWVYNDAERRGKPGCLIAFLTLLVSWPLGIVLWLVMRPSLYEKQKRKNDEVIRDIFGDNV